MGAGKEMGPPQVCSFDGSFCAEQVVVSWAGPACCQLTPDGSLPVLSGLLETSLWEKGCECAQVFF